MYHPEATTATHPNCACKHTDRRESQCCLRTDIVQQRSPLYPNPEQLSVPRVPVVYTRDYLAGILAGIPPPFFKKYFASRLQRLCEHLGQKKKTTPKHLGRSVRGVCVCLCTTSPNKCSSVSAERGLGASRPVMLRSSAYSCETSWPKVTPAFLLLLLLPSQQFII